MDFINHVRHSFEVPQACTDSLAISSDIVADPANKSGDSVLSQDEIDRLFELHQFANIDGFVQNHQIPLPRENFTASFDALFHQDFAKNLLGATFSSVTSHKQSDFSNGESTVETQIMEMIGMQQIPGTSQKTISGHCESSLNTHLVANAQLESLTTGGSLEISKTSFFSTQNFFCSPPSFPICSTPGASSSSSKRAGELSSIFPRLSSESESTFTFHEGLGSQSNSASRSSRMNFPSVTDKSFMVNSSLSSYDFYSNGSQDFGSKRLGKMPVRPIDSPLVYPSNSASSCHDLKESCQDTTGGGIFSDSELFDCIDLDLKDCNQAHRSWDDIIIPEESANCPGFSGVILNSIPEISGSIGGPSKDFFPDLGPEQLEAISIGNTNFRGYTNDNTVKIPHNHSNGLDSITSNVERTASCRTEIMSSESHCWSGKGSALLSEFNIQKLAQVPSSDSHLKSQFSSWIDDCNSINAGSAVMSQPKKKDEPMRTVRKRARPGENTRPRPKDRQLIQDRVKELREIVPNSAKCSIDSLLERTIKHMLYLQSVTKYADKLKQADEPKMIAEESGVVLRDNSSTGGGGGATWAFEVAGQTMVCPIIVEDLSPPGQMLIEMLCEERGLFLEIADVIRGFGLTILKGVMEVRNSKIWSRFLVEATGTVTRMEIFLSLVQLLQQTNSSVNLSCQQAKAVDQGIAALGSYRQARMPFPISLGCDLQ